VQAFGAAVGDMLKSMSGLSVPADVMSRLQADYVEQASALWNDALGRLNDDTTQRPSLTDRRFAAAEWAGNPGAAYLAQMYLLNARTLMQLADAIEGDEKTRQRIRFAVQQWIDAAAPSNYLALNPEAQRRALETRGESITQGLQLLWKDIQRGHLSQTDESVFEVGRNVATSEGSVVYQNELFQLLDYKPLTAKIYERPLLMVPPCINKFYILDLQPENSLIRYAVEQGHRVFVLSWRNPDESLAAKTWDDYIEQAVLQAIGLVQDISRAETINTLGFCVGGTLLATALAVAAARGERPAASMTLLTTLLDFEDTGVLDLFVDEAGTRLREMTIGTEAPGGPRLLQGKELATTFSFLRPNDLVWNYVVGNYLKGETPPPFDLLYWNSDGTNLPGPMYCWYLRNTYLENQLKQPGRLNVCGQPVDFAAIQVPSYVYGSREDHIVPWQGAYRSVPLLGDEVRFTLGASGHIAGVINPPTKRKRSHWVHPAGDLPQQAEAWLSGATEQAGSWWPDWAEWLKALSGKQIAAPKSAGNRRYKAVEPAPGSYVKARV
jgi:polyhydroxyalkanoate synthase